MSESSIRENTVFEIVQLDAFRQARAAMTGTGKIGNTCFTEEEYRNYMALVYRPKGDYNCCPCDVA